MRTVIISLISTLAAVLLFVGAGSSQTASVEVGSEAPDFALESLDGATYRLSDLRGASNAIVIFFRGAW